ncbi:Multicopper oxidase with three cupredoxin domains (includes cell division protein FtsP and spore coat protein CotA) [Micromonospora rhizosphaerae]|uniref:Multicopper oxidase with three cupredoxin domains (Includes cell division protein FtsP and spore coat protein CotA) n=1 Tax=Micromonospora rhizosphaerae TaxID=568872 RepID=A0A1C6SYB8_9ACTN|nr:multicopper oxidase family protein [Micromonospora rhizosphaerae]SCL34561.1 Multicopper oxidase with three cupredoxin domains (includes cell division protein FtsP and spore coat protein CotA) [Micromonospora rhizosphaerae]
MTTGQLIIADHVVALLSVAAWFAAGATAAARRARLALGLLAAAVLVTLARVTTVAMLAGRGWWFVQEKVLLGLPMLGAVGLASVLIAGPRLLAARRAPEAGMLAGRASGDGIPASSVVLLLTAGYAALAGLMVTFLVGYPLTWSTALIASSVVCAVALLTARVAAAPADTAGGADIAPTPAPHGKPGFSRRRFISLAGGAAVVGTGTTGVGLLFMPAESAATGGGPGRSSSSGPPVSVADLRGAGAPAPGGTRRQYVLTAQTATVRLPSGREIQAWTYNGQAPGPPITAEMGDLIEVTLRNTDIDDGVTLHWHGYDVACGEDGAPGVTQDVVAPGEEFVYRFRADQVGTYWYHTHQASHRGVRRGLYGTLVVTPRGQRVDKADASTAQLDLTLPVHTFDGTVLLADQDKRTEHTAPAGTKVRLRLINTDSDPHRFALAGTPFRVTAVDGRDLNQPGEVSDAGLRMPGGGRYDLVFVMPDTPVALVLDNDHAGGLRLRPDDHAGTAGEDTAVEDTSGWPELDLLRYGTPTAVPFDAGSRADRHFTMVLDRGVAMLDGRPAYAQTVNGRGHPSIPDQLVAEGELVRFTVVNRSLETHPWHLHGHPVLILSRNSTPRSGSPLWMDTFDVRPGEVWEVAFKATNPGIWMNHCHNLPHAHQGMMLRLCYDGVTTPFHGSHTAHGTGTARSRSHGH